MSLRDIATAYVPEAKAAGDKPIRLYCQIPTDDVATVTRAFHDLSLKFGGRTSSAMAWLIVEIAKGNLVVSQAE